MRIAAKYFWLLVLFSTVAYSQQRTETDSLENVLFSLDQSATAQIIQTAETLITMTESGEKQVQYLGAIVASYASKNEKEKSIQYLYRAKAIAEKTGNTELITRVYTTLASLYGSLKLNNKAQAYLEKAQGLVSKMPDGNDKSSLTAFLYNEWGNFHYNLKDYEKSNDFFRRSLTEFEGIDNAAKNSVSFYQTSALYHFGRSFLFLNQPDSATMYLDRAFAVKDTSYHNLQYLIKISLAEAYTLSGKNQKAIDTLLVMLADPKFEMNESKAEVYLCLSKNYRILGDMPNYSKYNEKYLEVLPLAESDDLKAINAVFDAESKVHLRSEFEMASQARMLIYLIVFVLIAGAVVFYIVYRKKKREQAAYHSIIQQLERQLSVGAQELPSAETRSETSASTIPPHVEQELLEKLELFEKSSEYTNQNLTIASLAVQLNTNTTYLSDIINRNKGKNFNSYINELRINYICKKIYTNPEYRNYKISYLATECGFASHSAFATVFKNISGISPSAFLKQALDYNPEHP